MIRLERGAVPADLQDELNRRTVKVKTTGGGSAAARRAWRSRSSDKAKRVVRMLLQEMASGVQRCMYCEDSRGTDIDHFQPLAVAPLRTFDWLNHLLACSHCNSNEKRNAYPCDESGECLLVDPTIEDPTDHLMLLPASGKYEALTPKGEATIRVFGLDRKDLEDGRRVAFIKCREALLGWHLRMRQGDTQWADEIADALRLSPFANVLHSMIRMHNNLQGRYEAFPHPVHMALAEWMRAGV